jgi:hypothetical protein
MLPKIRCAEGKVHLNGDIVKEDFILHANGIENIDKKIFVDMKDLEHLAIYEPDTVIIGTGFRNRGKISEEFLKNAKKQKIDIHVLATPEAITRFFDLIRKGKKVVAHIRVGD